MGYFSSPDPTAPKFTGQYRDYETTNDWFLARTFGPGQGRFQSVDPGNAGADPSNPQTWNAYAYVANNPLSYTDPSGMMEFIGAGAEIGSVAGPEGAVVGAVVGAVLDLGALFYGLFGGGGGSPPPPNWANVQQPTASGNNPGEPWSEQNPYLGGGSGGGFNPGGLFGGGNTSPFVLSLTPAQQMTQDVWIARIEGAYFEGLGPIGSFVTKSMFMYAKTRTGGPWDFKNQPTYGAHPELDDYGNCHYGAVGNALGLPNWYTRWAAGAASYGHFVSKGKTPPSSWGRPWSSIGGGDSPKNQVQIRIGQTTGKCAQ
jgi:RHS repeat-associated protein